MKRRLLYSCLFIWLGFAGLASRSFGQTIVTGPFSPSSVCAGGTVSISYTVSGTFAAANVFTAQLSDVTGAFPASPVEIGSLATTNSGTITATIPLTTGSGTGYRVRVVSSSPARTGSTSLLTLTVTATPAPGVTVPPAYCQGATASALMATPSSGGSLRWYGTAATGGTASTSATVPSTSVTGNSDYYVSQVVNGCESPRAAITVTVAAKPSAPGTSSLSYCVGQSASSLTATPVAGATLNWYGTAATGGTASSIAPTPSTSSAGTTTYYVSQVVGTCESPRAALPVTVYASPAAPSATAPAPYCEGATAVTLTATGQNLKWYATNPTGGSGSSSATIPSTTIIGTTNYYVSQTVSGCESARTAIPVTVNSAPPAPSFTAAPVYCQNQTASALVATPASGATLNWYGTVATGGTASASATVPNTSVAGTVNYYVSQTLNGCEGPRAVITVTTKAIPAVPTVTTPLLACQNRTGYSLTATPASGGSLNWYGTAATGGTATTTPGPISTTATGSTTYYVSQVVNGCESPRAAITVTVNAVPAAPTFTAPAPYCEGVTATALAATGQSLKWYGTSSTAVASSTVAPIPGTAAANIGTTTYYVTQTVNGCESERAGIPVIVKDTPSAPATAGVDFCQGSTVPILSATLVASATANWYGTAATGGTPATVAPVPANTTVGTTVYYVSQTLNGCEGPRASLSVRVKALPTAPAVSPVSFCFTSAAAPLTATGINLKWYDAAGAFLPGTPTPATTKVGNQVFMVSQTSAEGCEGPKASLTVTINPLPAPPTATAPKAYCQGEPAAPLAAVGVGLKWYGVDSTNKAPTTTATVPVTTPAFIGTRNYYVTQTVLGCESSTRAIPVIVKPTPNPPAVQDVSFCQNYTAAVLVATPVPNATLNWYGENASGGTPSATPPVVPNTVDKTYTYYVSQTLDGCESGLGAPSGRAQLKAQVKTTPNAPGVSPISFCNNGPAQALKASGTNLKWYDSADNLLGGSPTPNTGTVGNQTYKVSQTSAEGCESPKASLPVTINALPPQPGVSNLTYCQAQQDQPAQNLAPLTASGQNLKWYNSAGNQFPIAPTPTISQTGTQVYLVSQTVNNCEGDKAPLQVVITTLPAPTTPKSLVVYCVNDKAVPLEATGETGSQLKWIDPYGRVTSEAPTPLTLNTNIEPGGDPFYVYQIGTNGCYSPRAVIRAVVTSPPTLALVAPITSVNLGQKVPLKLKFTSSGPFNYTLTGGYTGNSLSTDTTIAVLPRGNTIYQVEAVSNGCGVGLPGSPATAQVTVRVPTITTSALTATSLCVGTSLSVPFTTTGEFNSGNAFRLEVVSMADTSKKYELPGTASGSPVTGVLSTTLPGGQYLVRVKADNPEIGIIGSSSPTPLTIKGLASALLTGTQTIYEGVPANLTLTLGGDSPWTVVYADSLRSYSATTATSPYVIEVRPSRTMTYRLTSVANACGSGPVSGSATISVLPLLGVVDNPLDPLVKTYPVPTSTILWVDIDLVLSREPATLFLTDAGGRPILQRLTHARSTELDLTTQPSGVYLLRIQVGDRQTVRKILKQ